jgi:carboxypeptidase family protein/TonB-dependent receptor-like protein
MKNSILAGLGLIFVGAVSAWASTTGTISGVVSDPSGGVVPGAEVTVTEVATGVAQAVRTGSDGVYSFLSLPVGGYQLEVKAGGFRTYVRRDITLSTNDKLRFDVVLEVGQVTQQVEVSTSAVHVETANTQLGDVVNSKTMEALPLNGREFTNLLGLQPGVVPEFTSTYNYNSFESTEGGNVSISGQRETANGFLINGANVDNALNNATTVIPNLDSIDEFRVLTANFDAEYGNYSGGLITVATKAGTNQFHGDGFEFLRNEKLDSRNFYEYNQVNPVTNQEIPASARGRFQRNQFGGTLGGPIKRDRAFFFADYQGTRERRGEPSGLVLVM